MTRRALLARAAAFFLALPLVSRLKRVKAAPVYVEPPDVPCRFLGGPWDGETRTIFPAASQSCFPYVRSAAVVWTEDDQPLPFATPFGMGIYDRVDATTFAFRELSWPEWPEVKRQLARR